MIDPSEEFRFENLAVETDRITATWTVPSELKYLEGHFPNEPVVPGVALIDGALELIKRGSQRDLEILSIQRAKFSEAVPSGKSFLLRAELTSSGHWGISFEGKEDQKVYAEMCLELQS